MSLALRPPPQAVDRQSSPVSFPSNANTPFPILAACFFFHRENGSSQKETSADSHTLYPALSVCSHASVLCPPRCSCLSPGRPRARVSPLLSDSRALPGGSPFSPTSILDSILDYSHRHTNAPLCRPSLKNLFSSFCPPFLCFPLLHNFSNVSLRLSPVLSSHCLKLSAHAPAPPPRRPVTSVWVSPAPSSVLLLRLDLGSFRGWMLPPPYLASQIPVSWLLSSLTGSSFSASLAGSSRLFTLMCPGTQAPVLCPSQSIFPW